MCKLFIKCLLIYDLCETLIEEGGLGLFLINPLQNKKRRLALSLSKNETNYAHYLFMKIENYYLAFYSKNILEISIFLTSIDILFRRKLLYLP